VSPPTELDGSSQPARVNCPASHVYDAGSSRRGQAQLQNADRVTPVGHRHDQLRAAVTLAHVDLLSAEHAVVHGARELQGLRLHGARPTLLTRPRVGRTEADECTAAEVGDQETHRAGPDQDRQLGGDRLDRVRRLPGLDPLEQRAKIGTRMIVFAHP
jgi:hypothetical protein